MCSTFIRTLLFLRSQTASWISAAPAVLEEYMQCVSNGDDLKFLLQSKQCHGKLAKSSVGMFAHMQQMQQFLFTEGCIPSYFSLNFFLLY